MDPIPQDVVRFMQANIDSLEQLELLRILSEDPNKEWDMAPLGRAAQAEAQAAAIHLAALASRGLLTVINRGAETAYRHGCASPAIDILLGELLRIYKERPVSMIRLVYAQSSERLRAFAEAFRVRKEK